MSAGSKVVPGASEPGAGEALLASGAPADEEAGSKPVANTAQTGFTAATCVHASWYLLTACVGGMLVLAAATQMNAAFATFDKHGLPGLHLEESEIAQVNAEREQVMSLIVTALGGLVGFCVAITVLFALHSLALRGAICGGGASDAIGRCGTNTVFRIVYTNSVKCCTTLGIIVGLLLLGLSGALRELSKTSSGTCSLATSAVHATGFDYGQTLNSTEAALNSSSDILMEGEQLLMQVRMEPVCTKTASTRAFGVTAASMCAQLTAVGGLSLMALQPDQVRLTKLVASSASRLLPNASEGGAPPALIVEDVKEACYRLGLTMDAFDGVCDAHAPTMAATPRLQQLRLKRAADRLREALEALIETNEALYAKYEQLLKTLASLQDSGLGYVAAARKTFAKPLAALRESVHEWRQRDMGKLGTALCRLAGQLDAKWAFGIIGALMLIVAMIGCRVAAEIDMWFFYTVIPLGPLLKCTPCIAVGASVLGGCGACLMLVAYVKASSAVEGGLQLLEPVTAVVPSVSSAGGGVEGLLVGASVLGVALTAAAAALAICRGRLATSRYASYPVEQLETPQTYVTFAAGTQLSTLCGQLGFCLLFVLGLLLLLLVGGLAGAGAAGASKCAALLAQCEADGCVAEVELLHNFTKAATALVRASEPAFAEVRTIGADVQHKELFAALYEASNGMIGFNYSHVCADLAASPVHFSIGCVDVLPALSMLMWLGSTVGLVPQTPSGKELQDELRSAMQGAGMGAVYGGSMDGVNFGSLAAGYAGATSGYYEMLAPMCSVFEAPWEDLRKVCAAPPGAGREAGLARLGDDMLVLVMTLDSDLKPQLAHILGDPEIQRLAALAATLHARDLNDRIEHLDQLDVRSYVETACTSVISFSSALMLMAGGTVLVLLAIMLNSLSYDRYTLYLSLVDYHGFNQHKPTWPRPDLQTSARMVLDDVMQRARSAHSNGKKAFDAGSQRALAAMSQGRDAFNSRAVQVGAATSDGRVVE